MHTGHGLAQSGAARSTRPGSTRTTPVDFRLQATARILDWLHDHDPERYARLMRELRALGQRRSNMQGLLEDLWNKGGEVLDRVVDVKLREWESGQLHDNLSQIYDQAMMEQQIAAQRQAALESEAQKRAEYEQQIEDLVAARQRNAGGLQMDAAGWGIAAVVVLGLMWAWSGAGGGS